MPESILTSTKKVLGMPEDYVVFDPDVIMHINSTFSILQQLGVGPEAGFFITDKNATWEEFIATGDPRLNMVKSYMCDAVRLQFDPPISSFGLKAMQDRKNEYEWRLNVNRENEEWVDPWPVSTTTE